MKCGQKGYSLIELLVALPIMGLASVAAGSAIFQIMNNTESANDRISVVRQVENAGYWISGDAQMALVATTTANLTDPNFLVLNWIEWDDDLDPIYHSSTYFFTDVTDGIGTLKRNHVSTTGDNQTIQIAQYIYYDPADIANTSNASYQSAVLNVKITAIIDQTRESKEYNIKHRPNF